MLRKLNFTEREKLARADFRITLRREQDGTLAFDPVLQVDALGVPATARVFVEAVHRTSFMRFDCGSVGKLAIPSDRRLTDIDGSSVRFRLKIVSADDWRILAVADDVRVTERAPEATGTAPLLPVDFTSELGQQAWRVVFDVDVPVLQLNNRIDGIEKRAKEDPFFFALVYPAAIREILTHILLVAEHDPFEESDEWWSLWLRWAAKQTASPLPAERDDAAQWIEDVVHAFCETHKPVDRLGTTT